MRLEWTFARSPIVVLGLVFSSQAMAQSVNFRIGFTGLVDCVSPIPIQNVPISGDGAGRINADGSASAELTQTAFILSTKINFEGRIGATQNPAPGGTAQVRVAGKNSLLLIWNLPNNALTVNINVRGRSCTARFDSKLRPGKSQHTLYDGNIYHYCDKPRVASSSCEVN